MYVSGFREIPGNGTRIPAFPGDRNIDGHSIFLLFSQILVYTSYASLAVSFSSVFALVLMRFTRKDLVRPFKLPLVVPLAYLAIALAFLIFPFLKQGPFTPEITTWKYDAWVLLWYI
jgi:amino acid transporter